MSRLFTLVKSNLFVLFILILPFLFCQNGWSEPISNVRVTNVRGTQFTVSWTSPTDVVGQIRYGQSLSDHGSWESRQDDRGAVSDDIHHVTITGLTPNTTYLYEIISGTDTDNNSGSYYSINAGPALLPTGSCQPAGKVFKDPAMAVPAHDSIVYVTIRDGNDSATESVLVTSGTNGYWFLDLVNFRTADYAANYPYVCGTSTLFVEAQGGNDGAADMVTPALDFSSGGESSPMVLSSPGDKITGRITAQGGTAGIQGVCVQSFADPCYQNQIQNVNTDAQGNFTLTIPAGTQAYVFANGGCAIGSNYTLEWFDNAQGSNDCNDAVPVSGGDTVNLALSPAGTVEGYVYEQNGTTPVRGICVNVSSATPPNWDHVSGTCFTDENGFYRINSVPEGSFFLKTHVNTGQSSGNFFDEWYGGTSSTTDPAQAQALTITADQTRSGVNFQLDPSASISGTLTFEDGTPFDQAIHIEVVQGDPCGSLTFITSAPVNPANGTFTLTGMAQGQYFVRINPSDPINALRKWWNPSGGSTSCSQAEPITIDQGQVVDGLTMKTAPGAIVSGTVYEANGTTPINGNWGVHAFSKPDHFYIAGSRINSDGSYAIKGLSPGEYYIKAQPSTGHMPEYYDNALNPQSASGITITGTETVPGIDFQLSQGGSLSGTVLNDQGQPVENLVIQIFGDPCYVNHIRNVQTNASGYYRADGLPAQNVYVRACADCTNQNMITLWWNASQGTTECGHAEPVSIVGNQETPNINFELSPGPKRVEWAEVFVSQSSSLPQKVIGAGFDVLPGFSELVQSAAVTGPNGFTYDFDLQNDLFDWLNQCNYLIAWWHDFTDIPGAFEYGVYTITVTFKDGVQESYAYDLQQVDLTPVTALSHTVNADGTIDFSWTNPTPAQPQRYQVRIYQNGERVYRSSMIPDMNALHVSLDQLKCVIPGGDAAWEVRAYDVNEPYNGMYKTDRIPLNYAPASLVNRITWFDAVKIQGTGKNPDQLELSFDLRPGSRNSIANAVVTGPNGFTPYIFDLGNDVFNMTTETRLGMQGWSVQRSVQVEPIQNGEYTLRVQFNDAYEETQRFTLSADTLTPVDAGTMGFDTFDNGAMRFFWSLPQGITGQNYQIRVRSEDGQREFVKSSSGTDMTQVHITASDLKALPLGGRFRWFVRSFDSQWDTRVQSDSQFFTYNPFNITVSDGGSVSGTVYESDGVTPIAGLQVYVKPDACSGSGGVGANTDANGNYTIRGIPEGLVNVRACPDCNNQNFVAEWYDGNTGTMDCNLAADVQVVKDQVTPNINFQLDTGATISGTLFQQDGSTPFDQAVEIQVLNGNPCQGYNHTASAIINSSNGTFSIPGIPAGQYYLKIRNNTQTNAIENWWNSSGGSIDCSLAELITISEGQTLPDLSFKTQTGGSISGTVYESNGVILVANLKVYIKSDACNGSWLTQTTTDANGNYTIKGIPEGTVNVGVCPECNNLNYVPEWYDGNTGTMDCNLAADVQVVKDQVTPNINFQLDISSSISGRVTDMDGNGLANVDISSFRNTCYSDHLRGARTNADGYYTISGIPDNTDLYLFANADANTNSISFKNKWYDNINQNDCASATAVHVTAGQPVTDINFQLEYDIVFELQYIHKADGSFGLRYYLEFYNLNTFSPDSVVNITLTGPSGNIIKTYTRQQGVQGYGDFEYVDQWKMFQAESPGNDPELGEYTFTVTTDTFTAVVKRQKTLNREIPSPETAPMTPVNGSVLTSKTPTLSWAPVQLEGVSLFYRVQIFDSTGYRVFRSNREQNLLAATIPNSVLTPGETYEWMVDVVSDTNNWEIIENRANSEMLTFTMADAPAHASIPAIDPDGWGVVAYKTGTADATSCWIKVIDHDGVAYNGSSHQVTVTHNGISIPMIFQYADTPVSGYYELYGNIPATAGDYVFTVTDPDGNTAALTDTLVVTPLPLPDANSFSVNVSGTTPTFTWNPVATATRYRVRIFKLNGSTVWKGYPETTLSPSYTVPPGVLQPNTSYNYRIEAWDAHDGLDIDNASITYSPSNPAFQTGDVSTAPFIETDTGAYTWNDPVSGTRLSFWTKIHDAQGVPSNIKSVEATFPDGTQIPLYLDYTESSTCGIYVNDSFVLPIAPGSYTITVEDNDGNSNTYTETLDVNPIGYPPDQSITAVFNGTQADVSWDPVPGAAFYRLEIYDTNFNRLGTFAATTNSYKIPAGIAKDNTFYRYRVTTRREFFDRGVDNGSSSNSFDQMKSIVKTPVPGAAMPTIDLNNNGAYVIHTRKAGSTDSAYWLAFEVKVQDADGVPENILGVQVVYPDGTTTRDLILDKGVAPGSVEGVYSFYEIFDDIQNIQPGLYYFVVTDAAGNTATTIDNLVIDSLSIPNNCFPTQGSFVGSTTPVITWDPVPGATRYRVRIYKDWNTQIHSISNLTATSYSVPADLLEMGKTYHYRIQAYKDIEGQDLDNMSINQMFPSVRPHFTINPMFADTDGDGISDTIENMGCTNANDADTDDDGIPDGNEDKNHNGIVDATETDPCNIDTDGDGLQDGTESGYTASNIGPDTDTGIFQPDLDTDTTTDPLNPDSDGDGWSDGQEDANHNGWVDNGETNPRKTAKEIVIDNDDPGTSYTGAWYLSTSFAPHNGNTRYTSGQNRTYTFERGIAGPYEVSFKWTSSSNRSANVRVDIYNGDSLLETLQVDQRQNGGKWNVLGTYTFDGKTARIIITSTDTAFTFADAIRFLGEPGLTIDTIHPARAEQGSQITITGNAFGHTQGPDDRVIFPDNIVAQIASWSDTQIVCTVPSGTKTGCVTVTSDGKTSNCASFTLLTEIIVDNDDPATSATGTWYLSTWGNPHGGDARYTAGQGNTYTFEKAISGLQEVFFKWTANTNRSPDVQVDVYNGNTLLETVHVNQRVDGSQWNLLGLYDFDAGMARIKITGTDNAYVFADAIRFLGEPVPVSIDSVTPAAAQQGTEITITGTDFGDSQANGDLVRFANELTAQVTSWSDTQIVCTVPAGAVTGCVTVTTAAGTSNCVVFTMISDTDGDNIYDHIEDSTCTDSQDADTDDDGIPDGWEDANHNGVVDAGETDPCNKDTDGDGIQDGTESGYTISNISPDTNTDIFQADLDDTTTTDPLNPDTDGDGWTDGQEDANQNGKVDNGETNPKETAIAIIMDNDAPGTSSTGSWYLSTSFTPYNGDTRYTSKSGNTYTFEKDIAGSYEVSFKWTSSANRSATVRVDVYTGDTLLETLFVDQRQNGGLWNVLGTYDFYSGTARIVISSTDDAFTFADAIRFLGEPGLTINTLNPSKAEQGAQITITGNKFGASQDAGDAVTFSDNVPAQIISWSDTQIICVVPPGAKTGCVTVTTEEGTSNCASFMYMTEVIVDNDGPGTSSTGAWYLSTWGGPYAGDTRYTTGQGNTYTFEKGLAGFQEISFRWTSNTNRSPNVRVDIYDGNTLLETLSVNQRQDGGQWNLLGAYTFNNGMARVTITGTDDAYIFADAVRFYGEVLVSSDSDGDGIADDIENVSCTDSQDADTDDDGIPDGWEDANQNGVVDANETDPCNIDTDGDGIQDGTESGYTAGNISPDTDTGTFQPDLDPTTTTDPLNPDSDGDGLTDGQEDVNHNGRVDDGETNPREIGTEVIIDNDDPGTAYTGSWYLSSSFAPHNGNARYTSSQGKTYTFETAIAGYYAVSLRWTSSSNRSSNARIDIFDGNTLLETVSVDQTQKGGQWNTLGAYNFDTGMARVKLTNTDGAYVFADAVRFVGESVPVTISSIQPSRAEKGSQITITGKDFGNTQEAGDKVTFATDLAAQVISWSDTQIVCTVPSAAETGCVTVTTDAGTSNCSLFTLVREIIVDNDDPGTAHTGSWYLSSWGGPLDGDNRYTTSTDSTYSFEADITGIAEVSFRWTAGANRSSNVRVDIYSGSALLETVYVNQKLEGSQWNVLGSYNFDTGRASVKITSTEGAVTVADAVRFIQ